MLNRIWSGFFFVAFISSIVQWLVFDQVLIFEEIVKAIFDMSRITVEIAIGLIGILSFWLGMMKIAEHAGIIDKFAQIISPLFVRLMPGVPSGHPAIGSMTMNLSANFLGLDNAATPLGLKAMQDLQLLNPKKETATNAQILFLVLNTSSVTMFPVTVFVYRAQLPATSAVVSPICAELISMSYITVPSVSFTLEEEAVKYIPNASAAGFNTTSAASLGRILTLSKLNVATPVTYLSVLISPCII